MIFRTIAFSALVASFAAGETVNPGAKLSASSKAGQRLLSKARALNDGEDRDVTWVAKYDIKYKGCAGLVQFRGEEGGGGGDDEGFLYTQNLVKFSLCPSDESCSECRDGPEYVVNMMDFVQSYTQYKQELQEQACENVAENCDCENANDDDACEYQCYVNAGMEDCIENEDEDGGEEFEIQDYLECKEMEAQNDNNNNGAQYFIGPYCSSSDGWSIHLGVFADEACSSRADTEIFSNYNYGQELPYSNDPIVESECISCMQVDDNDDNDNNDNNQNNNYYYEELEVNEMCDGIYEQAAKCERGISDGYYPDTSSCEYIENILPKLEYATRSKQTSGNFVSSAVAGDNAVAKVFMWTFAATTVMFGSYAVFLYKKLTRGTINLNSGDGALA